MKVGDIKSYSLNFLVGVPQGSILDPLPFSMYVNIIPNVCKNVDTMYADYTVIFTFGRSPQEAAQ